MATRVLLLHGLWMPGISMARLARRVQDAGFETEVFAYPGAIGGPDAVLPALCLRLQHCEAVIGHSLGGLMTLSALRSAPELPVTRVVCLGSPLAGSGAARGIASHALSAWTLGRAAPLLLQGIGAWQGRADVGLVAGTTPLGLGRVFGRFREPNDGTVALSETRVDGLADHVAIASSHTGLVYSAHAAGLAIRFLREGRFGA